MITIIGLGNPDEDYKDTRHNAGREAVSSFLKKEGLKEWDFNKKIPALAANVKIDNKKVIFVLPETFMNKSGKVITYLKLKSKDILVVHDDVDLPFGKIKFSFGKRSGGHKGVQSIKRALKTKDFWRLRIGIQKKARVQAEELVLIKFTKQEKEKLKKVFKNTSEAIYMFLKEGPQKAMNKYNQN